MSKTLELAKNWRAKESTYSDVKYGPISEEPKVKFLNSKLLLSAPHAITHFREGQAKSADRGTGGLVELISECTGTSFIAETSGIGDPAWDIKHPYKNRIIELKPLFILDLHGMKYRSNSDIDLGLGLAPNARTLNIVDMFYSSFIDSELNITIGEYFPGKRTNTITSWAQSHSIGALQIEIGANLRPPSGSDQDMSDFIFNLCNFVISVEEYLRN